MPNYKLRDAHKDEIRDEVKKLCDRWIAHAEARFPSSFDELQSMLVSPEQYELMQQLRATGCTTIRSRAEVCICLLRDRVPGLSRSVGVRVVSPKPLWYGQELYFVDGGTPNLDVTSSALQERAVPADCLDPTTVATLLPWVDGAIKQRRIKRLVIQTMEYVLGQAPTTGDLLTKWPTLATFVKDAEARQRLRNPPVRTKNFQWKGLDPDRAARMKVCDAHLLAASMMTDVEQPTDTIIARIGAYEALETDRF